MLGGFAVGKTSLVARYVSSMFSDRYQTTVGVKIDKKMVTTAGGEVTMVLWDVQGEDGVQKMRSSYLRGSAGYVLVIDGTRGPTLEVAEQVQQMAMELLGPVPFVVFINKTDLEDQWDLTEDAVRRLANKGWLIFKTSAKTGVGVEDAFLTLAQKMVEVGGGA
jgi:small GTP-binding protein